MDLVEKTVLTRREALDKWGKEIRDVRSKVEKLPSEQNRSSGALEEMKQIKEKDLPNALIGFELGRVGKEEVEKLKKRLHDLEDIVTEHSLVLKGLDLEQVRYEAKKRDFGWFEQYTLNPYRDLKKQISEKGPSPDRVGELRRRAKAVADELGLKYVQDTDTFLNQGAGGKQASKQP